MVKNLFSDVKEFFKQTYSNASHHNISLHGAGIAFYTIFSIAPLIVLLFMILGVFMGEEQTATVVSGYLQQLAGGDVASTIIELSENPLRDQNGLISSVIAMVLLLFGATRVVNQLKSSLNAIWEIDAPEKNSIVQFFLDRFISLVTIFLITAALILVLLLESGMGFFNDIFTSSFPETSKALFKLVAYLFSFFIPVLFFTLLFRVLPDINAQWKDIFVGACMTTFLFLIGKYLIGLYLAHSSIQTTYETAGTFIIFLLAIYYNVQLVLWGAEFTRVYAEKFGKTITASRTRHTFKSEMNE